MTCAICQTRRARRYCPGVRGEICSICCGTEREVTVDCPFECPFLQEARHHEKRAAAEPAEFPNQDIRISERFVEEHQALVAFLGSRLVGAALRSGAVDFDVREALDGLIRTYRTLQSGVYYDSVPPNPFAAAIYRDVQAALADYRNQESRQMGVSHTRDADVLGSLVFLQRIEFDRNNSRRRGRAFLHMLSDFYTREPEAPGATASPLILP